MSSSTKTTQPRDPANISLPEKDGTAQKKPTKASRRGQHNQRILLIEHESSKTSKTFRPWQRQAHHRREESQTGSLKLCRWQAQASPAKTMSLTKWSSKISFVAGPVKTTNLVLWNENFVTGRPNKDHEPYKWSLDGLCQLQIVRLMVFAAATGEIVGLHLVRLMVFAWPASDRFFASQIVTSVVLTGPIRAKFWNPSLKGSVPVAFSEARCQVKKSACFWHHGRCQE